MSGRPSAIRFSLQLNLARVSRLLAMKSELSNRSRALEPDVASGCTSFCKDMFAKASANEATVFHYCSLLRFRFARADWGGDRGLNPTLRLHHRRNRSRADR